MSADSAKRIYETVTQGRDIATYGDIAFYGKIITLPDGSEATKLFERSTASKRFLSLVAPQKLRKEKELAFDLIIGAVKTKFPKIDANPVMELLGIQRGKSIKLSKLRGANGSGSLNEMAIKLNTAMKASDIQANSGKSKNRFDQWHLQKTPGLDAVAELSGEDVNLFSAKLPDVNSFKKFVRASLDSTVSKTGDSAVKQEAILNFISGWCQMNDHERSSLKSSLSVNGQVAFDAISTLVNKMVAVDKLPVTQANSFGLDRLFARSGLFQRHRGHIKKALTNRQMGTAEAETAVKLKESAETLGKALGEKWRTAGQQPRNYLGLESQSRAAIRSFLDANMPLVMREFADAQKAVVGAVWLLNKEDFISTMAKAAVAEFTGNQTGTITSNRITIGNKKYDLGKKIGDGGEGIIKLAETTNGEKIAVKFTLPSTTNPSSLTTEIDRHLLASSVNSENILALEGAFRSDDGMLSMAMEFAPHGDLANIFNRFGPDQRQAFIAQDSRNQEKLQNLDRYVAASLFSGLKALHEDAQMLHGDLKAANVFIGANGVPKLADFGRAVLLEENVVKGATADAMGQLAPEVAVNLNNYFEMTPGADVWSIGIILYEMKTGDPFPIKLPDKNKGGLNSEVQSRLTEFKNDPTMLDGQARAKALKLDAISDKPLADLLLKIFHPDPNQRPTASQALAALNAMAGPTPPDKAEQGKLLIALSQWPINKPKN